MKKALVVAGGIAQAALIHELKSRGIFTILADMNPNAVAVPHADRFYPISTMDVPALKQLAIDEKVDYVLTACADQVLLVTVRISEELGLPTYLDYETAKIVSDKQYMKKRFVEAGVPTAKYAVMDRLDESKLAGFEYPLIVKPVDCYSSRGVRKVYGPEELRTPFEEAVALSRTGTATVEEFCEGEELTIDVYVENGIAHVLAVSISDKIGQEGRFVIYRTRHPSGQPQAILDQIADTAQRIADAFGLVDSPMLIQAISDDKRIRVLEFCARTGGSIKFRLIKKASGFDVIKAAADLAEGKKPHVGALHSESKYLINMFLYCKPGVFDHAEGFDELLKEGIVSEYYVFSAKGKKFGAVTCSGDRMGVYTVQADTVEELRQKYETALGRVRAYDADGNDLIRRDMVTEPEFRV